MGKYKIYYDANVWWFDAPYEVRYEGTTLGDFISLRAAKRFIQKCKTSSRVIYEEDDSD